MNSHRNIAILTLDESHEDMTHHIILIQLRRLKGIRMPAQSGKSNRFGPYCISQVSIQVLQENWCLAPYLDAVLWLLIFDPIIIIGENVPYTKSSLQIYKHSDLLGNSHGDPNSTV